MQVAHPDWLEASTFRPRIYYLNPLSFIDLAGWRDAFAHARSLGFDSVLSAPLFKRGARGSLFSCSDLHSVDPAFGLPGSADEVIGSLVRLAADHDLNFMMDLAIEGPQNGHDGRPPALDPRLEPLKPDPATLDRQAEERQALIGKWRARTARLAEIGVCGFRCVGLDLLAPAEWELLIATTRSVRAQTRFLAFTPGTDFAVRRALKSRGFDASFSSLAWWDIKQDWFIREYRLQQRLGPQIAFPEAPFSRRLAHGTESREVLERGALRALQLAALLGDGLLVPMGFEFGAALPLDPTHGDGAGLRGLRTGCLFDLSSEVRAATDAIAMSHGGAEGGLWMNADAADSLTLLARSGHEDVRQADQVDIIIANRDLRRGGVVSMQALRDIAAPFLPAEGEVALARLGPGKVRVVDARPTRPIIRQRGDMSVEEAVASPRIAIEMISPQVDGGRFAVKRVVGEVVAVEADIVADGHDVLSASLLFRATDDGEWRETRMSLVENDRWHASFPLDRVGRHEFCVESWKNPFAIFRYELVKKHEARLDLHLEIIEGIQLVEEAVAAPASAMSKTSLGRLDSLLAALRSARDEDRIALLLAPELSELMALADQRPFRSRSKPRTVDAERRQAGFASWYQLFPRSQSGDPRRHGTFDDVILRLPAIREMGFDVVYFPPIHPIGSTNRKGRNNSLIVATDDPGSPYAIGSDAGGHEAIHPELGTFEDFDRLVEAASRQGLEIALDLAIQASPDHPWLKQHPGWFDWRPDGTIRFAENPPKKYEDIVNVDFYARDAAPGLWLALREIVEMWVDHDVKLFRVDNPHTKPLPFWEWLIGDIRARHPEVVFLSEAFTRPKVMYRLAKVGFSQSYTYFTWRNTKWELEQYMRELTSEAPRNFFRPHFFVNTHDINPDFLQNATRRAYLIRAALAATLSGLWGIYNGFELCEGRPDAKRKEYADSEKYEIRAWDYDRPGNIKAEIAMLNRLRRENLALQSHLGLTLLNASNDNVMFFEKASGGRHNIVLVAISLDPHGFQQSDIEVPLWHFGLDDAGTLQLEDLISGNRFNWTGKWQRIDFDPKDLPFAIWRVRAGEI
jgi:starch synthase (maltosyl-transferring)